MQSRVHHHPPPRPDRTGRPADTPAGARNAASWHRT